MANIHEGMESFGGSVGLKNAGKSFKYFRGAGILLNISSSFHHLRIGKFCIPLIRPRKLNDLTQTNLGDKKRGKVEKNQTCSFSGHCKRFNNLIIS